MKAATNSGFGQSSRIFLDDYPKPAVSANGLLVEVHASSVNPKDWKYITVLNQMIPRWGRLRPFILGDDIAGVIVDKGAAVTHFDIGDRVYGMSVYPTTGALAEYAILDYRRAALKPKNLDYCEAAAVPLAGLTALQALQKAMVGQGSKVLILGASGGVGTFATQIAKARGAEVTGVCSKANLELIRSLGADHVIDYPESLRCISSNHFDVVFDAVCRYSLSECSPYLKDGGIYIASLDGITSVFRLLRDKFLHVSQNATFVFVNANSHDLNTLKAHIEAGEVKPVIDSKYPFNQVELAYHRSKTGHARGKIVINVRPE